MPPHPCVVTPRTEPRPTELNRARQEAA